MTRSRTPTLAWEIAPTAAALSPVIASAGDAGVRYDVEVYDNRRLVYAQREVPGTTHTLGYEIEGCRSYRWSVRPSYRVDGIARYGEWMRSPPVTDGDNETATPAGNGNVGRKASQAPAYIQDFPELKIKC